ncbi:MAG: ATP-binding protein [Bacteroidia bacterium]
MDSLATIIKVGSVTSVKGRLVELRVDTAKNASNLLFNGELVKNVSVGSYIKIAKGFTHLVGKIDGEYITENRSNELKTYTSDQEKIKRILQVNLIGYLESGDFKQGIKELPLIDNEAYLLTPSEFNLVHKFVKTGEQTFILGSLALEKGKEIELSVDRLLASHIGIFGNTGSGKSYTLAKLYHEIINKYKDQKKFQKNARFLVIDFNGEYTNPDPSVSDDVIIEQSYKTVYKLTTRTASAKRFPVSKDVINDEHFWSLILHCTEKTQTPFVSRTLRSDFIETNIRSDKGFLLLIKSTLEAIMLKHNPNQEQNFAISFLEELSKFNFQSRITGLAALLADYKANLNFHSTNKVYYVGTLYSNVVGDFAQKIISDKVDVLVPNLSGLSEIHIVRLKMIFQFYYEIQNGYSNKEHIGPLMGRLDSRINDLEKVVEVNTSSISDKVLSIISLRDVNLQMRKVLPLIICKQAYEEKKHEGDKTKFLNIIIDEAHNILSYNSEREAETWKDYRLETFEEIIKEGRKFGVFLTIASQRPSDISSTIISQLHNYLLHRLINNKDIEAVEKTISYLDKVSFDSLPILPQGTCILAGIAAQLPIVIEVDKIEDQYKPFNETMELTRHWLD